MHGEDKLRDGAAIFRRAAERTNHLGDRDHLLACSDELGRIAEWIERARRAAARE